MDGARAKEIILAVMRVPMRRRLRIDGHVADRIERAAFCGVVVVIVRGGHR